tara:strand:- start:759 stop:1208 length:450 start_codon:yes stop_codon:yes gene_type:complete
MQATINVKNLDKVLKSFRTMGKDMKPELRQVIQGGAQLIRGEAVKSIQSGPKSGKIYQRYNPTRTHKASAPGEAPASDTGNLVRNIRVKQKSQDIVTVESGAHYSKFLEYGTSKMQARPFLFPAFKMSQGKIMMATFNRVKAFIQKVAK